MTKLNYTEEIKEYGALIIGKTMISAAEYAGRIDKDSEKAAEQRAELFKRADELKNDIIEIMFSDYSDASKKQQMERGYRIAVSYFNRIV